MVRAMTSAVSAGILPHAVLALGLALSGVVLWVIVLLGAIILGGLAVAVIRRMATGATAPPDDRQYLLERLEQLRRQGTLSEEEYRRARDSVLSASGQIPAGRKPAQDDRPADQGARAESPKQQAGGDDDERPTDEGT